MESLKSSKFNSFNNEEWLLQEKQSSSVLGGQAGSVNGTKCKTEKNDDGTFDICCSDASKD